MADSVAALHGGSLDVAQLFEPFVEQAVAGGAAIWHPASRRGPTSYTVFVTTRDRLAGDPEPFRRMARAMRRTQQWLASEPPGALAAAIADYFPDARPRRSDPVAGPLQGAGRVGRRPASCREDGFARLRRALLGSGFLKREVPFAECVDIRLAEEAVGNGG